MEMMIALVAAVLPAGFSVFLVWSCLLYTSYNLMTDEEKAKEDERNRDYASLEKKEQNEK